MPFFVLAGSAILGAGIGALGATSAASTEANAANQSTAVQQQMFAQTEANEQPFVQGGYNALGALQTGLGLQPGGTGQGPLNAPFSTQQFQASPGYQFQLQQGEQAVTDQASATGGIGGNTLKALTTFGQGEANQDYYNAMNAYIAQQNQQYNQLSNLVTGGQNAAGNLASASQQTGASIGSNITSAGTASAAGTIAAGNQVSGGVNNLAQTYLLSNAINGAGVNNYVNSVSSPGIGGVTQYDI